MQNMKLFKFFHKVNSKLIQYAKNGYSFIFLQQYYKRRINWNHMTMAPSNEPYCELIVVSFNNFEVISYQIKTLKKFFQYPFRYTVFDNSNDEKKSQEIYKICNKENVGYVKLPIQHFLCQGMESYSHGIALNYIFRNYINQFCTAEYIGVLDHDIFCVEFFDISRYLKKQPFYGLVHRRSCKPEKIKYIWPGLLFLRKDSIKNINLDFRPSVRLSGDTGVRLYQSLYSKKVEDLEELDMVKEEHHYLDDSRNLANAGYSIFTPGWIHCWNASNYRKISGMGNKMITVYKILDNKLEA